MANSTAEKSKPVPAETITAMAILAPAVGWIIPGAGHAIQKRWIRGLLLFVSIVSLFLLGLAMQGRIYKANGGDILDILGFVGDIGRGRPLHPHSGKRLGTGRHRVRNRGLWNKIHDRCRIAEFHRDRRRLPYRHWEETMNITLNHFSAALVFSLFASIVFGITHRDTTREMVKYGVYCFAMFLGGVLVAGWAMWVLRR